MLCLVNLQQITCASSTEMIESILLQVNQNVKAMITLGKLIFQAVAWDVWQERNLCIFSGKNMDWRCVAYQTHDQILSSILFLSLHLPDHVSCHWYLPPNRMKHVRIVVVRLYDLNPMDDPNKLFCFFS